MKEFYSGMIRAIKTAKNQKIKERYQKALKREIIDDIESGTFADKTPEELITLLQHAEYDDAEINEIISRMEDGNEHIEESRESETILISGPVGIGKTKMAKDIHNKIAGPDKPFIRVAVDFANPQLSTRKLFGSKKGTYTGAETEEGAFVKAGDGTVFIDDLQYLPLDVQKELLNVLDTNTIQAPGSLERQPYEAKVILATNVDPEELVENDKMLPDLYSRLTGPDGHLIEIGDLEDDRIMKIVNETASDLGINVDAQALSLLQRIDYDYGVRELLGIIYRSYHNAISQGSDTIRAEHIIDEKTSIEKRADEIRDRFNYDPETMRYLVSSMADVEDDESFPYERIARERIAMVYENMGGDEEAIESWLQKGDNLGMVTKNLRDPKDLSDISIRGALKKTMSEFAMSGDIVKGMNKIIEWVESDPFTSLIPEKEEKDLDDRVLEAMDDNVFIGDEDVLGIAERL